MSTAEDLICQARKAHASVLSRARTTCAAALSIDDQMLTSEINSLALSTLALNIYEAALTADDVPKMSVELITVMDRWHEMQASALPELTDRAKKTCAEALDRSPR